MASEEQQPRWKDSTAGIVKYLPRSDGNDDVILADAGYLNTLETAKATAVKALREIVDYPDVGVGSVHLRLIAQAALDALGSEV